MQFILETHKARNLVWRYPEEMYMNAYRLKCMPTGGCVVSEIFVRFAEEDKWQIICAGSSTVVFIRHTRQGGRLWGESCNELAQVWKLSARERRRW